MIQRTYYDQQHLHLDIIFAMNLNLSLQKNMRKNGIILSDDVLDNDAFYDFTNKKELENYLIKVNGDSGLGVIINH